ncbi:MAG: M28 family peptidase [Anaerolineae bacterium]|nr:M28 family peptidase [Anaerolineae bacterium]
MTRKSLLPLAVVFALVLALTPSSSVFAFQPSSPLVPEPGAIARDGIQTITPIPEVQEIIDQVNLARMMTYTSELSGEQQASVGGQQVTIATRYTYNRDAVLQAAAYMTERLERLGLTVTTHWWTHSPQVLQSLPNVVAEKPGTDPSAGIYIIGAHLDDTSGSATTLAPGADDNGSGSVAVLTAAELLTPYTFDATIRFVLFTGEEQGLWGSQAYANSLSGQDIRGMLNMDMIAWDSQDGPDMDIHARSSVAGSVDMGQTYADVISAYSLNLTPVIYSNGTSASDHASFWNIGVPAILAIENYYADTGAPRDFNAYYHSVNDRVQYFNQPFFHEMTAASLATLAHLAGIRSDCYWADLNCDEQVTVTDITAEAIHWQSNDGQWNYSPVYDIDGDNDVDIADVQSVAAQWGWTLPG